MERFLLFLLLAVIATSSYMHILSSVCKQRGYTYSHQTPRTQSLQDTRNGNYENFGNRQTEQNVHSDYQDSRIQRIQHRISELRKAKNRSTSVAQLNKKGASDPVLVIRAEFDPQNSEECRRLGYCKSIPNYPQEQVQELIETLGDGLKHWFLTDKLDTDDVEIVQREAAEFLNGLCEATTETLTPDSLPDKNGKWCTVLQDRKNNRVQSFRVESCNSCKQRECGCSDIVSFPPDYIHRCFQKYMYRPLLILEKNWTIEVRSLKIPSCCSCMIRKKLPVKCESN